MPQDLVISSPIGSLVYRYEGEKISSIELNPSWWGTASVSNIFSGQLDEYFAGKREVFTVLTEISGTLFQKTVWKAIAEIPYGQTSTYGLIAQKIGRPTAYRAVANACGKNPLLIVVPCHRVTGSHGKLWGYTGGGIQNKLKLLQLEWVDTKKFAK